MMHLAIQHPRVMRFTLTILLFASFTHISKTEEVTPKESGNQSNASSIPNAPIAPEKVPVKSSQSENEETSKTGKSPILNSGNKKTPEKEASMSQQTTATQLTSPASQDNAPALTPTAPNQLDVTKDQQQVAMAPEPFGPDMVIAQPAFTPEKPEAAVQSTSNVMKIPRKQN